MNFIKRRWWEILPFALFFLGLEGLIAFAVIFLIYAVYRTVPISPKRGRLLTWLIVGQTLAILLYAVAMEFAHQIYWHWLILITLEAICLVGIWQWKKMAAAGLLLLFAIHDAVSLIIIDPSYAQHHPTEEITGTLFLLLVFSAWLAFWIKALKDKWALFT